METYIFIVCNNNPTVFPPRSSNSSGTAWKGWDLPSTNSSTNRIPEIYSKQCTTHSQMDGSSKYRRSILGIYICYSRWICTRRGRFPKKQVRWKSCGHSMPLTSGEFPKLTNIGWGVRFSEPKFTSDGVKVAFRHEFPQAIGAYI